MYTLTIVDGKFSHYQEDVLNTDSSQGSLDSLPESDVSDTVANYKNVYQ